jgi:hypothetical protein
MEKGFGNNDEIRDLSEDAKMMAFDVVQLIKRSMEIGVDLDAHTEVTKRAEDARKLQSFKPALEVLSRGYGGSAHLSQTALEMAKRAKLTHREITEKIFDLEDTARLMLESSVAIEPKGTRSSSPLPKALIETMLVVDLLKRVCIPVGMTGGDGGGPTTRLMANIFKYTSGKTVSPDAVKQRLKNLKKHDSSRQG